jgi:hypothetical protein
MDVIERSHDMSHMRRITRLWIAATLLLFAVFATSGSVWAQSVSELIAIADKIQNDAPGIIFEVWTEGEKNTYEISESVVFGFKADKDCYVAVMNLGTSGQTRMIFPNKWNPDNKVEKGKEYRIPPQGSEYAFKLMGPPGNERVKVIASVEPVLANVQSLQQELRTPVEQSGSPGGTFLTMKNPGLVLKDIGVALNAIDPSKWATVELAFPVVAAGGSASPVGGSGPPAPAPGAVPGPGK